MSLSSPQDSWETPRGRALERCRPAILRKGAFKPVRGASQNFARPGRLARNPSGTECPPGRSRQNTSPGTRGPRRAGRGAPPRDMPRGAAVLQCPLNTLLCLAWTSSSPGPALRGGPWPLPTPAPTPGHFSLGQMPNCSPRPSSEQLRTGVRS